MPLKYEPKKLIHVLLPDGTTTDLFIRGNAGEGEVLARLGLPPEQYRLYREGEPLEGKNLKELGIEHHTVLEVRGGKVYRKMCRSCGEVVSGLSPEELQLNIGIHVGETGHRRFSDDYSVS